MVFRILKQKFKNSSRYVNNVTVFSFEDQMAQVRFQPVKAGCSVTKACYVWEKVSSFMKP